MLGELARHSTLPVPAVHVAVPDLLAMDFIETDGGGITPHVERHAAELIAALHATPRPSFGYERDTLIGPLPQPNPNPIAGSPSSAITGFSPWRGRRKPKDALPAKLLVRLERLAERLPDYLTEPRHPSLLHGDLWTGNVLVRGDRVAGFVDPAIYCGSPGDRARLHHHVRDIRPTPSSTPMKRCCRSIRGFHELRCKLYKLYPTLVHVRLFGAAYLPPIEQTVACRIVVFRKRTGPEIPGRSSLRNEPNSKGIAY